MLYEDFSKKIKKLMIDTEITAKEIAEQLGESQANIINKINRPTIRLMDAERILNVLGYEIALANKNSKEVLVDKLSSHWRNINPPFSMDQMVAEYQSLYCETKISLEDGKVKIIPTKKDSKS